MSTIIIKTEGVGDNATTEPSTLVKGEFAVNTQGGLLFHGNSAGATTRFKATTLAGTNYSLFTVSGSKVVEIGAGTEDYVLTSTGTGSVPSWQAASGGGVSLGTSSSTAHRGDHGVSAYNSGSTRYTHPTSAGNKHIPTGGSSGQFLKYTSSGTAVWAADNNTQYSVGDGGLTTNDFTNADHSKLNAIEASADVTDATNVTAAGALMDSECTDLAAVKATEDPFTAALLSKLNAIEASADVTDTSNVTSAGALMDSECSSLSAVKAFTGEAAATADQTKSDINGLAITTVGAIDSGSWAATDVAVTHGGTGSSSASGARSNLGVDPTGAATGLNPTAISGLPDTTIADADYIMFWDATDSAMKKVDAAELTAGGGGGGVAIASGDTNNYLMTSDGTGDSLTGEAGLLFASNVLTCGSSGNSGQYKVFEGIDLRAGASGTIQVPGEMAAHPFTGQVAIITTVDTVIYGGIVYSIG